MLPVPADDCLRQALSILDEMRQLCGEKRELEKKELTKEQQLAELMLRLAERSHQYHALLPPEDTAHVKTTNVKAPIGLEQIEPLWTEAQVRIATGKTSLFLKRVSQTLLKFEARRDTLTFISFVRRLTSSSSACSSIWTFSYRRKF